MPRTVKIEHALTCIEGGTFQRLGNDYLMKKKGFTTLDATGSALGSNKTKSGTPDALFTTQDGRYIFVEYSTQQNGLFNKFKKDIEKCLNSAKTNIPLDKIDTIIICHTSSGLTEDEWSQLESLCTLHKVALEEFNIHTIAIDLAQNYPNIAKEYLNIPINTGQIATKDEFIRHYEHSKSSIGISNPFVPDDQPDLNISNTIFTNELIIITGEPGIGKTRWALEYCDLICQANKDITPYYIIDYNQNIHDDLEIACERNKKYLIFIDDANRSKELTISIINLLKKRSEQPLIKIIMTVRAYALSDIEDLIKPIPDKKTIRLESMHSKQLDTILSKKYDNKFNPLQLDKISNICEGNPRLAMMFSNVMVRTPEIQLLSKLDIYDEYYKDILHELDILENRNELDIVMDRRFLKSLGVTAFFGHIDTNNQPLMALIQNRFDLGSTQLTDMAKIAYKKEWVDIHDDANFKISDQILSTYLFYIVFLKEKIIPLNVLLQDDLFPKYKNELKDSIRPIIKDLNQGSLSAGIISTITDKWQELDQNTPTFINFLEIFCQLKATETLLFIKQKIATEPAMEYTPIIDFSPIKLYSHSLQRYPSTALPSYIYLLSELNESDLAHCLNLTLMHLEKNPQNFNKLLTFLLEKLLVPSHYKKQKQCLEKIWAKAEESTSNELFFNFYHAIAKECLMLSRFLARNRSIYNNHTFLEKEEKAGLHEFRQNTWSNLFKLFTKNSQQILKIIFQYSENIKNNLDNSYREIVQKDSFILMPFFKKLDPKNAYHCYITQKYIKVLERNHIEVNRDIYDELNNTFNKDAANFVFPLDNYLHDRENLHHPENIFIQKLITSYSSNDYATLFDDLGILVENLTNLENITNMQPQIKSYRVEKTLLRLKKYKGFESFLDTLVQYLNKGDLCNLNPREILGALSVDENKQFYARLSTLEFRSKNRWHFAYYHKLTTQQQITKNDCAELTKLYQASPAEFFPPNHDYLYTYEEVNAGFTVQTIELIYNRYKREPALSNTLVSILNIHSDIWSRWKHIFSKNTLLLQNIYLTLNSTPPIPNFDYDKTALIQLAYQDISFIDRYLDSISQDNIGWLQHFEYINPKVIWCDEKWHLVIDRILKKIISTRPSMIFSDLTQLFSLPRHSNLDINIPTYFFKKQIIDNIQDISYIKGLFSVIFLIEIPDKTHLYKTFLEHNKNIDDFNQILQQQEDGIMTFDDANLEALFNLKINFYQSLIELCSNDINLLEHQLALKAKIKYYENFCNSEQLQRFKDK